MNRWLVEFAESGKRYRLEETGKFLTAREGLAVRPQTTKGGSISGTGALADSEIDYRWERRDVL
jgi:hypothetical protein